MLTSTWITAERQKHWDSNRNQLKEYRKANHGKYPDQGTNSKLYCWVVQQRKQLGPLSLLDTNLQGDAVTKQRIAILKSDPSCLGLEDDRSLHVLQ